MTTNEQLRRTYDAQYATGYAAAHTPVDTWEESLLIHKLGGDWRGKRVLEIGCGEGRLAALIAMSGAEQVYGVDYCEAATRAANVHYDLPNLEFQYVPELGDWPIGLDVVVMQGVLEHQDNWRNFLWDCHRRTEHRGVVITSSPSFYNPRGFVWQTLRILLGVPMSLTDLHAICPADMQMFANEHMLRLTYESCHHDWATGELMLTDYRVRLPKALADAGLPADRVPDLLHWLYQAGRYYVPSEASGATVVYRLERLCES